MSSTMTTMFKVQQHDPALGWINCTRAGKTLFEAMHVLDGYRQSYPADVYRLVEIGKKGEETPVAELDRETGPP
jgi:hypothetical protein